MICVSVLEPTVEKALAAMRGHPMVEIRLDGLDPGQLDLDALFGGSRRRTIATFRPGSIGEGERCRILVRALEAGADLVDIELETGREGRVAIVMAASELGRKVVISHHDHERTPSARDLHRLADACFAAGADVAKIACACNRPRDAARLLGLLDRHDRLVPIGMGRCGRITRIAAPFLGSPFTFASPAGGRETAPGQLDDQALGTLLAEVERD